MPERPIYVTSEDVERVLDSIEDQLEIEESQRTPEPVHWEPVPLPCERRHIDPLSVVVALCFLLAGFLVLAFGLLLNWKGM
jgi:hypothetical protein